MRRFGLEKEVLRGPVFSAPVAIAFGDVFEAKGFVRVLRGIVLIQSKMMRLFKGRRLVVPKGLMVARRTRGESWGRRVAQR